MKCPICENDMRLVGGDVPFRNADGYDNTVRAATACCGGYVTIRPIRSYSVSASTDQSSEDDWGDEARFPATSAA